MVTQGFTPCPRLLLGKPNLPIRALPIRLCARCGRSRTANTTAAIVTTRLPKDLPRVRHRRDVGDAINSSSIVTSRIPGKLGCRLVKGRNVHGPLLRPHVSCVGSHFLGFAACSVPESIYLGDPRIDVRLGVIVCLTMIFSRHHSGRKRYSGATALGRHRNPDARRNPLFLGRRPRPIRITVDVT